MTTIPQTILDFMDDIANSKTIGQLRMTRRRIQSKEGLLAKEREELTSLLNAREAQILMNMLPASK